MNLLLFFGGIALFLYAMQMLEKATQSLATNRLKATLVKFTRTPLLSVSAGILATSVLQSSSLLGLLLLALVAAQAIPLKNAIGVIIGANLGTTITGWLIILLGFKLGWSYVIVCLAIISTVLLLTSKNSQIRYSRLKVILAFSLLLIALWSMKNGVEFVYQYLDVTSFNQSSIFLFFLIGIGLTSLTQSSSATMAIALSAVNADVLEVSNAVALIIGADLGTTSTVILGSIRGAVVKRQLALAHLMFNTVVDSLALIALPILLFIATELLMIVDPLVILVMIHTLFNLLGLLLFIPFLGHLERLAKRLFPMRSD